MEAYGCPYAFVVKGKAMDLEEFAETLRTDVRNVFVLAYRLYGKPHNRPVSDYEGYQTLGTIPPYVSQYVDYRRKMAMH